MQLAGRTCSNGKTKKPSHAMQSGPRSHMLDSNSTEACDALAPPPPPPLAQPRHSRCLTWRGLIQRRNRN
ncbi:uncharacterized protein J3R85_002456 [Psidium guajava]|nr:uncharacterized protein J3R85_002456 [Psidium guajava]